MRYFILVSGMLLLAVGCANKTDIVDRTYTPEMVEENRGEVENSGDSLYFNSYECTDDCSGHEAGYEWAERKGIGDVDDCGGNSNSFIEGCQSYVEENY